MNAITEVRQAWLAQVEEDAIDPQRPIVDAHHHLWEDFGLGRYMLKDFARDIASGHNIVKSVFVECGVGYSLTGPEHLKPAGETSFAADLARQPRTDGNVYTEIVGIVAFADLRLPLAQPAQRGLCRMAEGHCLNRQLREYG